MFTADIFRAGQITYCAGEFKDLVMRPRGKPKFADGLLEQAFAVIGERTEFLDLLLVHLGVGEDPCLCEPFKLTLSSCFGPLPDSV